MLRVNRGAIWDALRSLGATGFLLDWLLLFSGSLLDGQARPAAVH